MTYFYSIKLQLQIWTIWIFTFLYLANCQLVPEKHKNWNKVNNYDICGLGVSIKRKIIGGELASLGEYPWIVQIGFQVANDPIFFCGGSIINENYVVSAGHCESGVPTINIVRAGEYDIETNPDCVDNICAPRVQDKSVNKLIRHEQFSTFFYDILLIKVDSPFKYNHYVAPICLLPGSQMNNKFGENEVKVAGWGIINITTGQTATKLEKVTMFIMPNEKCKSFFIEYLKIRSDQICVGGVKGKDTCRGDSGGPLMKVLSLDHGLRYYLLGWHSFGFIDCGARNNPGVHTRITSFQEWLLDRLN